MREATNSVLQVEIVERARANAELLLEACGGDGVVLREGHLRQINGAIYETDRMSLGLVPFDLNRAGTAVVVLVPPVASTFLKKAFIHVDAEPMFWSDAIPEIQRRWEVTATERLRAGVKLAEEAAAAFCTETHGDFYCLARGPSTPSEDVLFLVYYRGAPLRIRFPMAPLSSVVSELGLHFMGRKWDHALSWKQAVERLRAADHAPVCFD